MKVLMFGWEFPPHISGGLGTACYGLTKGMSHFDDLQIHFVIPKAYGDEENDAVNVIGADNVEIGSRSTNYEGFLKEINFIEVNSRIIPYVSPEEYYNLVSKKENGKKQLIHTEFKGKLKFTGRYGANLFQEIANYAVVASVIGVDYDFDIIHAHDWLTYPAGIAAKKVSGKPLVIHVHATDFDRSGGSVNPGVYDIEKQGMDAADKIIAVSNLTRKTIIEKYGISPDKVETIYNAVDPVVKKQDLKFKKGVNDKIVTFLGRITLQKGPEYFIEAAYKVLQSMRNVRFVMAGSGDLMQRMVTRVAALGISDRFHFTGFLSGSDVHNMFHMSDVYVMPSVSEPFGISPLEAMQSNVPVIISHQSGVSEILKHAIKVDFWDIEGMADAINGVLNYDGLSNMFKKHGKAEVETMKWEDAAFKVKNLYTNVLS
jgi:glycosyltransferase involved in cell wall biosynthesis